MLFSSFEFILFFLPAVMMVYYLLNHYTQNFLVGKWLLVFASLFFFGFWHPPHLIIILSSIVINFLTAQKIQKTENKKWKKSYFLLGLGFNLMLLGYYKYKDFFIENLNLLIGSDWHFSKVALPLGISFFTLQQIAYLVDVYEGMTRNKKFVDYTLFVSFFPQLIAGPIVHYKDLIPQFELKENGFLKHTNLNLGLFVFALGLFKKVILADTYSFWANEGFDHHQTLHFFYAWGTALSYTLQLYFDFSGYSDMAIGLGLMFNINIPQNFNSPFKSRNVIEFWTRWHMTLSQFITSYIFTPLFRSFKKLNFRNSLISVFMTMMIAGIWHGAGWTFVAYGAMYGTALVVNHLMKKNKLTLPLPVAVFVTFIFTIFVFTMFRASTVGEAFNIYKGMLGLNGFQFPAGVIPKGILSSLGIKIGQHMNNDENFHLIMILLGVFVVFYLKNSQHHRSVFKPTTKMAWLTAFMFVLSLFGINRVSDFIYFNF